jgi:hypothetical protein
MPAHHRSNDDSSSTLSDPAVLSAKVRELAVRSHRAISARPASRPADRFEQLRDLRRQVERLQRKLHKHRLTALSLYVDALGDRIDDRLGDDPDRVGPAVR